MLHLFLSVLLWLADDVASSWQRTRLTSTRQQLQFATVFSVLRTKMTNLMRLVLIAFTSFALFTRLMFRVCLVHWLSIRQCCLAAVLPTTTTTATTSKTQNKALYSKFEMLVTTERPTCRLFSRHLVNRMVWKWHKIVCPYIGNWSLRVRGSVV